MFWLNTDGTCVVMTYPDKFMDEQGDYCCNMVSMASDPDVKALIICQAVPGPLGIVKRDKR